MLALVAARRRAVVAVAERPRGRQAHVTAVVDGLVERGLLTREAVAGDRRSVRLAVTAGGRGARSRAAEEAMGERLEHVLGDAPRPRRVRRARSLDLDDALAPTACAGSRLAREVRT